MYKYLFLLTLFFLAENLVFPQGKSSGRLFRIENTDGDCGYVNSVRDTIIPIGKYMMCEDSIIKTIGFVYGTGGIMCIDNTGKELFEVFNYDNGPDPASNGLLRIVKDGKIGYANLKGKVVIEPQFKCAWPFEKGKAKVSYNCNFVKDGEITLWKEGDWFFIDKKGKRKK